MRIAVLLLAGLSLVGCSLGREHGSARACRGCAVQDAGAAEAGEAPGSLVTADAARSTPDAGAVLTGRPSKSALDPNASGYPRPAVGSDAGRTAASHPDAGPAPVPDAGPALDTEPDSDPIPPTDAGDSADASALVDAGERADASSGVDAAVPVDAGSPDAGSEPACSELCTAPPDRTAVCLDGTCAACTSVAFTLETQESCAIDLAPGFGLDGSAFMEVDGERHRVFALDRWGEGHVAAYCDATTLPQLLAAFDLVGYLGQTATPRVAAFGDDFLCRPDGVPANPLPGFITYLGPDLPASYRGNPEQLAADWDVIVLCGLRIPWSYDWAAEIEAFVAAYGKGFLAVMDYAGIATVSSEDLLKMNRITSRNGIVFRDSDLPWTPAAGAAYVDCVLDRPPVP